jgi:hypothetical protein
MGMDKYPPSCTTFSAGLLSGMVTDLVGMGITGVRLELCCRNTYPEATNDNGDPFSINQATFNAQFERADPDKCNRTDTDAITKMVAPLRTKVLANNETFESYVNMVLRGASNDFNGMPTHWKNDEDEASEVFHAYAIWFHALTGFYPNLYTFNEPDGGFFGTPSWMGTWAKSLGDRLTAASIPVGIETPSLSGGFGVSSWDNVRTISGVDTYLDRFAGHAYDHFGDYPDAAGITARQTALSRAQAIGAQTGMTEICCRFGGGEAAYGQGQRLLRNIWMEMTVTNVSTWEELAAWGVCASAGCPTPGLPEDPIGIDTDLSQHYLRPTYWVQRQWMKYIRPGYVRIGHTCASCGTGGAESTLSIKAVAFKRPNGTVIVGIMNDTASPQTVTLNGLPSGNYTVHKLDPTMCVSSGGKNRCAPTSSTFSGTSQDLSMPANAVWTVSQN